MKKMVIWVFVIIGLILLPAGVYADSISVGDVIQLYDGPGTTGGGEFKVYKSGVYLFDSFCLETNEYFSFGQNLTVASITDNAIGGGSGGPRPDPLDPRTAYLYYHFRMGDLAGYNYGTNASADDLQKAIWYIEEEAMGVSNDFVTLAQSEIDRGAWSGLGNVWVMNLIDANGNKKQDQMVLVPEPATILLLGAGLLGLGIFGRKKVKKIKE